MLAIFDTQPPAMLSAFNINAFFKYFDAAALLRDSQLEPGYVLLSLAIMVAALASAYLT